MRQTQLERQLLLSQTQRAHAVLQYGSETGIFRALPRLQAVREGRNGWANWASADLLSWANVDDLNNCLPFEDAPDLVCVPRRRMEVCFTR